MLDPFRNFAVVSLSALAAMHTRWERSTVAIARLVRAQKEKS